MAQSLVVIGERFEGGDGAVFIERTSTPERVLSRLQRWAPRELIVLAEIAQAGALLDKVACHSDVHPYRLRSQWLDLGAGAVEIIRRVAAEVDDREHTHAAAPSDSAYSNKACRHPDCRDAHTARPAAPQGARSGRRRGTGHGEPQQAAAEPGDVRREGTADSCDVEPVSVDPVAVVDHAVEPAQALLNVAIDQADRHGNLPPWVISATAVAAELGMPVSAAQAAIQALWGSRLTMGAVGPKLIRRVSE